MKIFNCENLELAFSSTDRKKNFLYNPILKDKKITAISTFNAAQLTGSSREATVMSEADAAKTYLTLVSLATGKECVKLPLRLLNPAYNNGQITELGLGAIDWEKSYMSNSATVSASSAPLFVYYE
ncbi:MAG: hypothetical protein WCO13_00695 [Bacteroidota bacterium]